MQGATVWGPLFSAYVFLWLNVAVFSKIRPTVLFEPGAEYVYKYDGFTHIQDVAQIKVSAQVGVFKITFDQSTLFNNGFDNLTMS